MEIKGVRRERAEQTITVGLEGKTLALFDGYKEDDEQVARFATAEWMTDFETQAVLWILAPTNLSFASADVTEIIPDDEDPDDYHGHVIQGTIEEITTSPEQLLSDVCLYGDRERSEGGIPINSSAVQGPVARFQTPSTDILSEIPDDEGGHLQEGKVVKLKATRLDIVGFRAISGS